MQYLRVYGRTLVLRLSCPLCRNRAGVLAVAGSDRWICRVCALDRPTVMVHTPRKRWWRR